MKNIKNLSLLAFAITLWSCKDNAPAPPDNLKPVKITIAQFMTGQYRDLTVQIDSVFFDHPAGTKFNGTTSNANGSKTLRDCNGDALIVFTSADRDFSYRDLPTKMGTIYGVASEYQGTIQFLLRTFDDVSEMVNPKCEEKIEIVTIAEVLNGDHASGTLVKILDVQFTDPTKTWNFINNFEDCAGNTMITYVPSSADFKNEPLPQGNGPLIGMLELFNTTWELKPRSLMDGAAMINERCTTGGGGGDCTDYLCDDFEGGSLTGKNAWTRVDVVNEKGSDVWYYDNFSSDNFAEASAYSGSAKNAESWLISPSIDLSASTAPKLSFSTAANFGGLNIEVYVSTTYTSGAINIGDWTQLTGFALSTANSYDEVASGNIDLSAYKQAGVKIAFRYRSTEADGSRTWQLDDISIKE